MLSCPNKRLKIWKDLVEAVGEPKAYVVWGVNNGMVEEYLQSILKPTQTKKADIERRQRVTDIITSQLELGVELPKILETLAEQGYVEKINGNAFFKQSAGRDAIIFNIDGAIVPIYRSSQGTSSKTKGEWYPFFFNGGDWLVKAGADTYKNGYNNPIIKQILDALNKNYKYDKAIATVEGNNNELLSLLGLQDLDVSYENNSGIYDYQNYAAIAIILKDWQSKLGDIDVTGYQKYLDSASSSLIKANPTLKSEIQSAFNEVSKLFAELAALEKDNKKEEDLKNRLQELKSQLPTPGLEMPKTIDDTVLFELRKVYSMRANKRPQAEKKLLETYGPERIARAKYIEENFQKIVEGIVSKKINFFYDKDSGKFERCP